MSLILHRPRNSQPQDAAPANPELVSAGMVGLWTFASGAPLNHVTGALGSIVGTTSYGIGPKGRHFVNDQNSYASLEAGESTDYASGWSAFLFGNISSSSDSYASLFCKQRTAGVNGFQIQRTGTSDQVYLEQGGATATFTSGGNFAPSKFTGREVCISLSWVSADGISAYIDGLLAEYKALTFPPGAGTAPLKLGASRDASTLAWAGNYRTFALFKRPLSAAMHKRLADNELELFEPRRIYIPVSVAGGAYSLNLEASSYALTGSDLFLLKNSSLNLESGAYTLNGSDTTLLRNSSLTLESGSYGVNGQNASLLKGFYLEVGASNYTVSGADATLTYNPLGAYTLNLEPGTFSLSGADATVLYNKLLSASSGTYTVNGANATLTYTPAGAYSLNLEPGAYMLTGSDVTFTYSGSEVTIKAGSWIRYRIIT